MQVRHDSDQLRLKPHGRPAVFFAVGLLSFLAVLISYLAGRGAGLPPDDPQYFGVGVSIMLAFACAVIVVQNKRLRRMRRALANLSAEHAALAERNARPEAQGNVDMCRDTEGGIAFVNDPDCTTQPRESQPGVISFSH